jgi:hypothetical protein
VIEKLRTSWRSYREKRRQYQVERAVYKAGGGRDAQHGGAEGGVPKKRPDDLSKIGLGGGPPTP